MGYETVFINRYPGIEEISIRQEVEDFFTGFDYGEEKKAIFVTKRIKRTDNKVAIKCQCWDPIRNEGKAGCFSCNGLGYRYDEELLTGYLTNLQSKRLVNNLNYLQDAGRSVEILYLFYTTYEKPLYNGDIILKPICTSEGFIDHPLKYEDEYIINNAFHYRLDGGRSEFNFYSVLKVK